MDDQPAERRVMGAYAIVPASVRHVRAMSQSMRPEASLAVMPFGFEPRAALRRAFVASFNCRTALVDGKPAAMWGVAGALLGDTATVWLVLSRETQQMPRAVLREARAELRRAAQSFRHVVATVLPNDEASIRFAVHLGFRGEADEDGPQEGDGVHDILTNPAYRIPLGEGYAIRLGYRNGAA